mgnify:CR=1 FL=1
MGAEHVGIIQSLLVTCKLHKVNFYDYLVDVLQRISCHPASKVNELTPSRWKELFADNPIRSDLMAFNLGAKVSFETDQGRCFGRLAKYNQKTVTVITDEGQQWRIPPHLLSAVKDITPKDNNHNSRHRNKKKRFRKK